MGEYKDSRGKGQSGERTVGGKDSQGKGQSGERIVKGKDSQRKGQSGERTGYGVNSPGAGRTNGKSGTYNTINRKRERSGAGLKRHDASKACGVKRKGRSCKETRQLRKVSICVTIRLSRASWEIRDAGIRRVPEGAGAAA